MEQDLITVWQYIIVKLTGVRRPYVRTTGLFSSKWEVSDKWVEVTDYLKKHYDCTATWNLISHLINEDPDFMELDIGEIIFKLSSKYTLNINYCQCDQPAGWNPNGEHEPGCGLAIKELIKSKNK